MASADRLKRRVDRLVGSIAVRQNDGSMPEGVGEAG